MFLGTLRFSVFSVRLCFFLRRVVEHVVQSKDRFSCLYFVVGKHEMILHNEVRGMLAASYETCLMSLQIVSPVACHVAVGRAFKCKSQTYENHILGRCPLEGKQTKLFNEASR